MACGRRRLFRFGARAAASAKCSGKARSKKSKQQKFPLLTTAWATAMQSRSLYLFMRSSNLFFSLLAHSIPSFFLFLSLRFHRFLHGFTTASSRCVQTIHPIAKLSPNASAALQGELARSVDSSASVRASDCMRRAAFPVFRSRSLRSGIAAFCLPCVLAPALCRWPTTSLAA